MSPADELHQAAQHIRDVAGKATPGPWLDVDHGDRVIRDPDATAREDDSDPCGEGPPIEYVIDEPLEYNPDNGAHFVLWDPPTALLVAEVLDNIGKGLEYPSGRAPTLEEEQRQHGIYRHEIALARAINAKSSSAVPVSDGGQE